MANTVSMAGNFNPLNKMFVPNPNIDYSAYLGTPQMSFPGMSYPQMSVSPLTEINSLGYGAGLNNGYMYNPLQMRAESLTLNRNIKNLYNSVINGEADRVGTDFESFKQAYMQTAEYKMLTRGSTGLDEKAINEMVADKYRNVTGIDLANHIDENVRGNFFAGLWNGMTLGLGKFKSNDDLKHEILGENKPSHAPVAKTVGSVAGGAAIGAAVGSIIPGVGTAIGAGVGAVCGLISRIWD